MELDSAASLALVVCLAVLTRADMTSVTALRTSLRRCDVEPRYIYDHVVGGDRDCLEICDSRFNAIPYRLEECRELCPDHYGCMYIVGPTERPAAREHIPASATADSEVTASTVPTHPVTAALPLVVTLAALTLILLTLLAILLLVKRTRGAGAVGDLEDGTVTGDEGKVTAETNVPPLDKC